MIKSNRALATWHLITLLTTLSLFLMGGTSRAWAFTGEACGRYAHNYEDLRWCQVMLELGAIEEVVTRAGTLRHGTGDDWYLDHTALEGETLSVDLQRLSNEERSQLANQCGKALCTVSLTGVARDRMVSITSFEVLAVPH